MPVSDLLQFAIDKAPTDFADKFNEIVSDRIASVLEDKKIEYAQAIYGEPTDTADDEEPLDVDSDEDIDADEDEDEDDLDIDLDDLDIDLDDLDLDGETDDD